MTLNLDDLIVTSFATASSEDERLVDSALSRGCPQSWRTDCVYTCVTCNGCESGTGGAC